MTRFFSSRDSCTAVKNNLILDSEGKRVAVKYYSDEWPTNSSKLTFVKFIFAKTLNSNAHTEGPSLLYKWGDDENELVLAGVFQGLFDAIALLLRNTADKKETLENLDLIFLCIDESVDQGIILETDANVLAGKVAIQNLDVSAPLSEQTIRQAMATAREHLTRTLLHFDLNPILSVLQYVIPFCSFLSFDR